MARPLGYWTDSSNRLSWLVDPRGTPNFGLLDPWLFDIDLQCRMPAIPHARSGCSYLENRPLRSLPGNGIPTPCYLFADSWRVFNHSLVALLSPIAWGISCLLVLVLVPRYTLCYSSSCCCFVKMDGETLCVTAGADSFCPNNGITVRNRGFEQSFDTDSRWCLKRNPSAFSSYVCDFFRSLLHTSRCPDVFSILAWEQK